MDKKHKYINVVYQLYAIDEDGKKHLMEKVEEDRPFFFISGFGTTLDAFEKYIEKLDTNEEFDFTLPVEEAYGKYEESHVVDMDREIFTINNHFDHEHIFKGATVPLQNEDGNHFWGRVLEITDKKVRMDLNHPLAGKPLNFKGRIVENRDATEDEVRHMIKILSGEACGCGCGCGHDHGDCDCGHDHADCDCGHDHSDCGCGHHK